MKKFIIIFLHFFIIVTGAYPSTYLNYELTPMDQKSTEALNNAVSFLNLIPLVNKNESGIAYFGVNQIYVNSEFNKMAIFKYNVKGNFKTDAFENINNGYLYHFEKNNVTNALFTRGLSQEETERIINNLKSISFTSHFSKLQIIETAHASDCIPSQLTKNEYGIYEKISSHVVFQSLVGCATGVSNGAYDATFGSVESMATGAWNGLVSLKDNSVALWNNPTQTAGQFYNKITKGVTAVKDVFVFVSEFITNPEFASAKLRSAYGSSAEKIINIFESLKNLPAPVMFEAACSTISGIGIDVLIAYLTAGAGSAKLILTIERLAEKAKTLKKIFTAIALIYNTTNKTIFLTKEKLKLFTRRILENKIPEIDLNFLNQFLGKGASTDTLAMETLACYIK
jgi:hypothetical protein